MLTWQICHKNIQNNNIILGFSGELFSIDDRAIVADLSELLSTIQRISSSPNFVERHNDQSVVEICLTRIISAIRYIIILY